MNDMTSAGAGQCVDTLLEQFDIALSQHQRLLKLDVPAAGPMLPHRLVGQEAMGQPFRYRLDCISQRGDIELKTLMAQPATLSLMQADGSYRDLNGLVEEAALLGEDGGVYYYQLTLVPWFSLLKLGRDSRIFQNLNVVDIATQVFDAHAEAAGRYRFDTRREYPPRSYCVQYRESDYHFVSRLFEEEGLFYYFEQSNGEHTLVITDDVDTCTPVSPQQIRFHRQDATESEDAITQWRGLRQLQPTRVTMGTFDYKQPSLTKRSALNTVDDQGNVPDAELYDYAGEYYYHEFDRGERLSENRLEAHESKAKRFHGAGGTRQLQAGYWFELTQHSRHDQGGAEEREFLVLGMTVHAENSLPITAQLKPLPGSLQPELDAAKTAHGLDVDVEEMADGHIAAYRTGGTGHFLIDFEAQRRTQPFRNARRHPRPVVGGPQTALIVGPEGEEIHTDHLNRVRAQFHWDRQGQLDENSSCWLRVAQPNAGAGWGGVFTPRVGQEVIVDFLEGDPDRPLITGRVYNGDQTPEWHSNGLFSGLKSKTYRGSQYNELLFDDATDQERVRLNSEHQKSQLNLGYLIHQNGNYRGAFRGTGFELRTDAYGTVRANQGLYLTSWGQIGASGEQLALDPAKTQLDAAYELTDTLSQVSADHNAETLDAKDNLKKASDDTDAPYGNSEQDADADQSNASAATASGGRGQVQGLKAPWLHLASPAGTTISTPESTHLAQGQHLSVSTGENLNLTSGKNLVAAIREKLSLFAYNAGIKLFAAKGKVEIQAQSDTLEMTAEKDVKISSTDGQVIMNAQSGLLLTSGGGYIEIKGGNINIHTPGTVDVKGIQHVFSGPASMNLPMPALPTGGASPLALNAPEIIEGLADRCSSCEPSVGNPVNPMLGVKLLPAETDFALPAPRPFSFSRGYLSSNARVGSLGQGWSIPGEGSFITLSQTACELHDAQGRVITFSALAAGDERHSQTEQLWIRRGLALQGNRISLSPRWVAVSDRLQQDADVIAVTDGTLCYLFTRPAQPEGRPSSSPWRLTAECDRNGYTTTYHWHKDRLDRVTDSAGRDYTFHYASVTEAGDGDTGDRLVGVQLADTSQMAMAEPHLGQAEPETGCWLVRYDYSSAGDLRAVHHRDERLAREFEWRQHILVAHRVPGGVAMRYEWDQYTPEGRVTAQHESQGLSRHFQYLEHQTLVTDSLGREERYHFAGEGVGQRWVAHTRADGSQLRFHYDRAGRRIATVDPLGRETRLERDEKGQLIAQVMPGGERWTIERNAQGLPIGMTGPEQTRWTIQRNERGNPVSVTGPNGTTTYDYDDPTLPDRPTTITDPSGARRHFVWNSRGQLQVETDCSHHATRYDYDADDQLEAVTNALGETHRMSHDVMGRRLNHELPDGALWQQHYDRQGRASSLEDPLGGLQQIEYDAAGRPIAQTYTDGSRQEVLYDQAGRITELVLGNGARYRFSYDAMDRVIREETPDGRDQRFEYDAAGQLIARTEMNRLGPDEQPLTTRYTYDANGRLIERHLPETEQAPARCEVFAWRADGHLSRAHNAHSDVLFHYDDAGRLAGEQQRHYMRAAQADAIAENEDWSWQTQHRFTETGAPATSQWGALPECAWLTYGSGHLLGLNIPALSLEMAFEPDALHRETQRQFSVDHQAASQPSLPQSSAPQPLVPQRLVLERGYTATGQVTHLATQGVLNGLHQHFDYDALGRMTHRETGAPHSNHAQRIDYTFDEAGRLIGSQHGPQTHHYPMDAAGNRLEPLDDGMTASSPHNQIHHLDGVDYRYDGAGNLIERRQANGERLIMGYDAANRLVHLRRIDTHGQTLEVDYQYDPLGRRTQKIVTEADGTTGTTHYGWDGDHLVHEDLPGQTSTTVIYEPGGFVPMLRIDHDGDDTRTSAYVTDALGTPMQLLDPDGTVRWQAQPDDWAAVHNETGDTRQPIRFQGQWHDEESGLYYNRHRYYDPQQGRYITQDPIGLKGGTNLYGYVGDPTSAIDPLGLQGRTYGLGNGPWGQYYHNKGPEVEVESAVSKALSAPIDRIKEGASGTVEAGGLFVTGVGFSTSTGVIGDSSNHACTVHTVCLIGGPRIGAGTTGNISLATGTFEPGDVNYSIAGEGSLIFTKADLGFSSNGSISASAGSIFGVDFGGALKICRTEVSNACWDEGEK